MIKAANVIRGGASQAEYDRLYRNETGLERKASRRSSGRRGSYRDARPELVQQIRHKEYGQDHYAVAQDGYGPGHSVAPLSRANRSQQSTISTGPRKYDRR